MTFESAVPRPPDLASRRQLVLPVHLFLLATLVGCISPVSWDVKLKDDGVVFEPVNHHCRGYGAGGYALPLRESQD